MAHQGQTISNPRTGQTMTFTRLRPELLESDRGAGPGGPDARPQARLEQGAMGRSEERKNVPAAAKCPQLSQESSAP